MKKRTEKQKKKSLALITFQKTSWNIIPNWQNNPDNPYRILIIGGSGSGKSSTLFNLISQEIDIDEICLYAKDPYESKNQLLYNKRKNSSLKHFNESKAFIEYSNDMNDIYKNTGQYN